jgi:hypothetical protein
MEGQQTKTNGEKIGEGVGSVLDELRARPWTWGGKVVLKVDAILRFLGVSK